MMKVPLLDLEAQYAPIRAQVEKAIASVMASHQYILGPAVQECERAIARYSNCAHGIGMSSGTDALLACLMSEGIGAGDEVITTPYTFFATAGCVARLGAKPLFVDIDPVTYNIKPAQIADRKSTRLNSSHLVISYAVFCLKKKKKHNRRFKILIIDIQVTMKHMISKSIGIRANSATTTGLSKILASVLRWRTIGSYTITHD